MHPDVEQSPVMLIDELAVDLQCSVRTVLRRLKSAPHLLPPEMAAITRTHRWSRTVVREWIDSTNVHGTKFRRVA